MQETIATAARRAPRSYTNPLPLMLASGARAETCADPTIVRGVEGDLYWYLYGTSDPLHGEDRDEAGHLRFRLIPTYRSRDLVTWHYLGDALDARPEWATDTAGIWAPEVQRIGGRYLLYFAVTETRLPGGGSAIGVATGPTPHGPWRIEPVPVVEPHDAVSPRVQRAWVFDPDVFVVREDEAYIYYGSYLGGVWARRLSADGLHADPATAVRVTVDNRYEAPELVQREDWYYLFVSATNCCSDPITGYSVFVGRSRSPTGPFFDREGVSLVDPCVGGTTVLSMNGDRWMGPGHNSVFRDAAGAWWTAYHAIDRTDAVLDSGRRIRKRPALLDALDWVDGWPTVRGGRWASHEPMPVPAGQPGDVAARRSPPLPEDRRGSFISGSSDEFRGFTLDARWSWIRAPYPPRHATGDGTLRLPTQAADLYLLRNDASVLCMDVPDGDLLVETRVSMEDLTVAAWDGPAVQAGLVFYGDDDEYIKLADVAMFGTRQTEFGKELVSPHQRSPRYGNTVIGPVGKWTHLRIVRRTRDGEERYQGSTSIDGEIWTRGGVWTHRLGRSARVGLVAMGGEGYTAVFDHLRVYRPAAPAGA